MDKLAKANSLLLIALLLGLWYRLVKLRHCKYRNPYSLVIVWNGYVDKPIDGSYSAVLQIPVQSWSGTLTSPLRVALFTDSYSEANGVATLSREFAAFARRRQIPFFCVHSGQRTQVVRDQSLVTYELKRGPAAFPLDHDLFCDPFLSRYRNRVLAQLQAFRPDLIHITGPGDMGILGFWMAHILRIPMVASWHTNLHEYAGRRLEKTFAMLPQRWRGKLAQIAETRSLQACLWFYHYGRFTLAPNEEMVRTLEESSGRPAFLMGHGVDTERFAPRKREAEKAGPFLIGYVGRLTPEKNVRLLAGVAETLQAAGRRDFRIMMVGDGGERDWLERNVKSGAFPGVLRGGALAEAFAQMDVFVFPSQTDTFGLVVLEAMSSGVPVIVTSETGRRVEIQNGTTGFYADSVEAMTAAVIRLMDDRELQRKMSSAARVFACSRSWVGVFDDLYQTYEIGLERIGRGRAATVTGAA